MNHISQHISYLLLTCREVNVPGLGTFEASYEKANFDLQEGVFYPSYIRVSFSGKPAEDYCLLESSLKRKFNLSDLESSQSINVFVQKIKDALFKKNYCRLEGIGYLIKNNQGEIILKDTFWNRYKSLTPMCF